MPKINQDSNSRFENKKYKDSEMNSFFTKITLLNVGEIMCLIKSWGQILVTNITEMSPSSLFCNQLRVTNIQLTKLTTERASKLPNRDKIETGIDQNFRTWKSNQLYLFFLFLECAIFFSNQCLLTEVKIGNELGPTLTPFS